MWGIIIAFQNYQPFFGVAGSKWVGLKHFQRFITEDTFAVLFNNTVTIALLNSLIYFPFTIILALLLNEVRHSTYKRFIQTLTYIPHFMSWIVIASISYVMLTTEGGFINDLIVIMGGNKVNFLMSEFWFRPVIIIQHIWKDAGWGSIIFLAALSGVDQGLYESARIDGANRWKQMWHITLPSIRSTILIILILRLGNFLDTGFDQIYNMMNALNRSVAEVFDTYIYQYGIQQGIYSYSTAVGLFKSLVGLILVGLSNRAAKKVGEEGIY